MGMKSYMYSVVAAFLRQSTDLFDVVARARDGKAELRQIDLHCFGWPCGASKSQPKRTLQLDERLKAEGGVGAGTSERQAAGEGG